VLGVARFEIAASYLLRRSMSESLRNIAVCFAGLLPALAGYAWFVWKLSAKVIFFENWISTLERTSCARSRKSRCRCKVFVLCV